jgi:hypothetical protein
MFRCSSSWTCVHAHVTHTHTHTENDQFVFSLYLFNRWAVNTSLIFVTNRWSSFGRRFDEELRHIETTTTNKCHLFVLCARSLSIYRSRLSFRQWSIELDVFILEQQLTRFHRDRKQISPEIFKQRHITTSKRLDLFDCLSLFFVIVLDCYFINRCDQ